MFYFRQTLLCCILLFSFSLTSLAQQFSDTQIEQRVNALLRKMTLEEKAGQITQLAGMNAHTAEMIKQGKVGSILGVLGAENVNEAQRAAVENSRLKIPLIIGYDVIHGYRTVFPVPLASAGSFDPQLIEQSERVAAKEASASGVKWTYAPMVDIARDPRWGRIVEGSGEDPYLGSIFAAARVRGFQGATPRVIATAKHFVAYGAAEGGRDYNSAEVSDSTLRDVYLPPFKAAIDAGAMSVMAGFDALDGVPMHENRRLITGLLRDTWHFGGIVE